MSSSTIDDRTDYVRGSPRRLVPTIRALAFWLAITLPIVQVAWLIVGLDGLSQLFVFVALLGLNGTSLAIGHTYAAPRSEGSSPDSHP
ncbi:MAG: hypothetical protein ACOCYZ_01795 [Halococcoides sp.]